MYSDDFKKGYGSIQKTQESEFGREHKQGAQTGSTPFVSR